jgi:hypothetical protein
MPPQAAVLASYLAPRALAGEAQRVAGRRSPDGSPAWYWVLQEELS